MATAISANATHNTLTLRKLRRGDRIEFKRRCFSHWGIYLGNEKVIHVTASCEGGLKANIRSQHLCSCSGVRYEKTEVRIDNFWEVVGGDQAFKNNERDSMWTAFQPEEIIRRAMSKLGNFAYNLLYSNCETFVNWCRYEVQKSDQVQNVMSGVGVGVGVLAVAGILGAGALWLSKKNKSKDMDEY